MTAGRTRRRRAVLVLAAVGALLVGCAQTGGTGGFTGGSAPGASDPGPNPVLIGLVTKTDANPYFVRLREATVAAGDRWHGVRILPRAGRFDGDNAGQVAAVDELVGAGVRGILITPSSSTDIVPALERARARGVMVIALDTDTDPPDAVDVTYATEGFAAGWKQGLYLRAALAGAPPRVALLDGTPGSAVSTQRHQGFLRGFGLTEGAPEIVAAVPTNADRETARQAMTAILDQHPDLDAVYTINEPVAQGAADALAARGATGRVKLASIDGSCPGVLAVRDGRYVATVMQFPTAMADRGVDAVMNFVTQGRLPEPGEQPTGSQAIAAASQPSAPAQDPDWGLTHCWG